ncbi:MAG: hypothetical protein ACI9OJ_005207, partial [Myxococcota bacterium]
MTIQPARTVIRKTRTLSMYHAARREQTLSPRDHSRVALGGFPPRAPTDPDVR